MRIVKKNVYYCEYCGKRKLSASHMKKHELGCTKNINRVCKLCEQKTDLVKLVNEYKKRFELFEVETEYPDYEVCVLTEIKVKWTGEQITIEEIIDSVDGCPNCTLAILNLAGLNRYYFKEFIEFNYAKELQDWWGYK